MKLIRLFESHEAESKSTTTTLYRGDATHIDDFQFDRADPNALVGPGIYLTDSRAVAKDYTLKGNQNVIFRTLPGAADDPRAAIFQIFKERVGPKLSQTYGRFDTAVMQAGNALSRKISEMIDEITGFGHVGLSDPRRKKMDEWRNAAISFAYYYVWVAMEKEYWRWLRATYDREYNGFKKTLTGTRMIRTVNNEIVILPADQVAPISVFEIPNDYLKQTFRVNEPMPDWLMAWIVNYMKDRYGYDITTKRMDMRYQHPTRGEEWADNFPDWIEKFAQYGMRVAWGENDHTIGGKGVRPSLMDFMTGTHLGGILSNTAIVKGKVETNLWMDLIEELKDRGYHGYHYEGGRMTSGGNFAGGSETRHNAYSLWVEADVRRFRKDTENYGLSGTDERLFKRFRFDTLVKQHKAQMDRKKNAIKNFPELKGRDKFEALIDNFLKTSRLFQRGSSDAS